MTVFSVAPAQSSRGGGRKALFGATFRLELRHFYIFLSFSTRPALRADKIDGWACLRPHRLIEGAVCSLSARKLQALGDRSTLFGEPLIQMLFQDALADGFDEIIVTLRPIRFLYVFFQM